MRCDALGVLVAAVLRIAGAANECDEERWLKWRQVTKRSDSNMRGYDFQFCCDVKSLRLVPFSGRWQLDTDNQIVLGTSDALAEKFPLTICDNNKLIFGQARASDGEHCTSHTGTMLPVLATKHNLVLNSWYAVCYDRDDSQCTQCTVELLCPNEHNPLCKRVWISGNMGSVSNTSMNFTVNVGEMPFTGQMLVHLYEQRLNADAKVIKRIMVSAEPHLTQHISMDNLKSDTYYVWSVCVKLAVSQSFSLQYNVHVPGGQQTICAPNVTEKTLTNYGSSERMGDRASLATSHSMFPAAILPILPIVRLVWLAIH